jgi:transcription elongation factor GreA
MINFNFMEKVYLTKDGKEKLESELNRMIRIEQVELIESLKEAREKGDISENAEYESAKSDLETLSRRISEMQDRLNRSEIITPIKSDKINMLSQISIKNRKTNTIINWTLVPENEVNIKEGKISLNSPIGTALLGKKVGEVVDVKVPAGNMQFEILEIL